MPNISHNLKARAKEVDINDPIALQLLALSLIENVSPSVPTQPKLLFRLVGTSELFLSLRCDQPLTPTLHLWAAQKMQCKRDNVKLRGEV